MLLDHLKASSGLDRFNALLEVKNTSGMTPLLIACAKRDFCLVELLVEAGADVKAVNNNGDSACSLAALSSCANDKKPSVESSPEIFEVFTIIIFGFDPQLNSLLLSICRRWRFTQPIHLKPI